METTIDLPDALARAVRLRAIKQGRDIKDAVTDLVRIGLVASGDDLDALVPPTVTVDAETEFPVVICPHGASPEDEMKPDRLADILEAAEARTVTLTPAQRRLGELMRGGR